ncbi:MAG: ABC transporter substrate-binding protein [Actinomycetia bacterium]|nr:ABC transporter substrate-binding protein [Actinomycetes bacterium]
MTRRWRGRLAVGAVSVLALTLPGCDVPEVGGSDEEALAELPTGGTLTTLALGPVQTWDPQRIASRSNAAFAGRVFARTLTAYQHGPDPERQITLTGDLATDIGSADSTLREWSFTLREGIKWQDGSELTCEDVKYGISRSFATDEVSGGPSYAVAYLDVPKTPDGASLYRGPYAEGDDAADGQQAFDRAVVCDGADLTIRLSEPVADFSGMVSTLGFAAVKESEDRRGEGTYSVFSAGPYTLAGAWTTEQGGTFVRNPHWSARTDPIRLALPDQIVYREGIEPQDAAQLLLADEESHRSSVGLDTAPPAIQQEIAGAEALRERSVVASNGLVDYLVPNINSAVMQHAQIRTAFALATDRAGYVDALGGASAARESTSILSSSIRGALSHPEQEADPLGTATAQSEPSQPEPTEVEPSQPEPAETTAAAGEVATAGQEPSGPGAEPPQPDRAGELLAEAAEAAGLPMPVPVRVAYRSSPTMDGAMDVLAAGWQDAGFDVELQPIAEAYFATIAAPDRVGETDVFWSNWAADWNSASTVLPPLFDSRLNITDAGSGRNYGYFVDPQVDAAMAAALAIPDHTTREQAWFDIDTTLRSRGAYIALAERQSMYLGGSALAGLTAQPALGGSIDLAILGVEGP